MDDLYDNLENYNETNVIEELRSENQELKAKVEKCTATIEKLQKDFDKLESEYKKLELNYSSLLKTARAEVERKTQIITNLNHEKDMMVLNVIQNKNVLNIRRNWTKGKPNNNEPKDNNADGNNKKTAANQLKTRSSSTGRKEASLTPSEDTTTTASIENANKQGIKNEKNAGRARDAKENVGESLQKARPARAGSIRCRRKSMPATRLSKLSSDEEGEISSPPRDPRPTEPILRQSDVWRSRDRNYGRQERMDYDNYNRIKNNDNDKYRSRDRFEAQRNRFSPERFHRRSKKDYLLDPRSHRLHRDSSGGYKSDKDLEQKSCRDGSGDYSQHRDRSGDFRPNRDGSGDHRPRQGDSGDRYQRPEHRKRRLESPPRDKYYQYQQKNHEQFEKDYNDERNKYLEDPTRVKYLSDYEEPSHKRLRTESHHSNEQDNKGQRGHPPDKASQPVVGILQAMTRDDMSCQSPDYLSTELATVPQEIKLDTEVKLDDPREQSDKYTITIEKGEKVLSTVIGRNVELKPVKNYKCNIPKVEIPKALMIPPSQSSDTVKKIYDNMDVDNAASDLSSVEFGDTMDATNAVAINPNQGKNQNRHENNTPPTEDVEELPLSCQELDNNLKKQAVVTENDIHKLQAAEKEIAQMDNVDECSRSFRQPAKCSENLPKTQQSDNKHTVITQHFITETNASKNEALQSCGQLNVPIENVAETTMPAESVAFGAENDANISQNYDKADKLTENVESTSKITCNIAKAKYKIRKISRGKSGSSERKILDDKSTNKGEADKHDNSCKTGVVDGKELNYDRVPAVGTGKGMVEGDLELSDENSDNIELVKLVTKELAEQSMPDLSKPNVENAFGRNHKKVGTESIKQIPSFDDINVKNIAHIQRLERRSRRESSDCNNKSKTKKKINKQIVKTKQTEALQTDALNKETKQKMPETITSRDMKNKFSDLFGDTSSSLITPEDLGLTATEIRIESSSSNYLPIFEDAQDAIDLGTKASSHTNTALTAISPHESGIDKIKGMKSLEVHNDQVDVSETKGISKSQKNTDNEASVKPIDAKETKLKCGKNTEKEREVDKKIEANEFNQCKHLEKQHYGNKKIDVSETKSKPKSRKNTDTEKQGDIYKPTIEQEYAYKKMEFEVPEPKSKSNKNIETEHLHKSLVAIEPKSTKILEEQKHRDKKSETDDAKTKYTETKRRKSKRNEEKSQPTKESVEITLPAVETVENATTAQATDKIDPNDNTPKEPVVKTVIISSGLQPSAQEMPVNNFSPILLEPPVTPNIESRQTRMEIPLLSHSVHIHALATSTPAKEIASQQPQEDVSVTTDASNASGQTSQGNIQSQNDMEAPDVRIFVKRRKRVVKKTTPSKI